MRQEQIFCSQGGLIIYCRTKNASSVMKKWKKNITRQQTN